MDEQEEAKVEVLVEKFDPHRPAYFGAKRDIDLSRDEMLLHLRFLSWTHRSNEDLARAQHEVLMRSVFNISD